jgi:hypothetical protein
LPSIRPDKDNQSPPTRTASCPPTVESCPRRLRFPLGKNLREFHHETWPRKRLIGERSIKSINGSWLVSMLESDVWNGALPTGVLEYVLENV